MARQGKARSVSRLRHDAADRSPAGSGRELKQSFPVTHMFSVVAGPFMRECAGASICDTSNEACRPQGGNSVAPKLPVPGVPELKSPAEFIEFID